MARVLTVGLHASDDPTLATLPFLTAVGAIGGDKPVTIALLGEAVSLAKEAIVKGIHGVGFPPLPELVAKVVQGNVRVFV